MRYYLGLLSIHPYAQESIEQIQFRLRVWGRVFGSHFETKECHLWFNKRGGFRFSSS